MTEPSKPFEQLTALVERVCGTAESPNLGNRAKLRRALRAEGSLATFEVLCLIGSAIGDRDTARLIELKAGTAALYAVHGHPGRNQPWTTLGRLLDEAHRSDNGITPDRAGRVLVGLLQETDPARLVRRCHRALTLCAKAGGVDTARMDWGRLLADLLVLTGEDPDRRRKTHDRWARDFARIPDHSREETAEQPAA